jgi:hypothetical protein
MFKVPASLLIVGLSATPLISDVDCRNPYATFVQTITVAPLSGDALAAAQRAGLRVYDACDTGHLEDPEYRLRQIQEKYAAH